VYTGIQIRKASHHVRPPNLGLYHRRKYAHSLQIFRISIFFLSADFSGGPAGSTLASKLALSAAQPRILLLEAGQRKDDRTLRVSGNRWTTFQEADINWGYKTTPQEHCNGREIDYSRGKVLGGGSAINFGIYTVGAKDDYDAWAEIVGDDLFNWENMKERFKAIESFDTSIKNEAYRSFAAPKSEDHGRDGALKLSYAEEWEEDLPLVMDAFRQAGVKWNMDHNSGDPIGVGLAINSVHRGVRSTASDVIDDVLAKRPDNLEVRTGMTVRKVVFDGDRAVGVQVGDEVCMYTQLRSCPAGTEG
jgi:choline dehydrogenase-like flavoprotein